MQTVLNAPMLTNETMELFCIRNHTADVILLLVKRFSVTIPTPLHHNAALDADPLMPKRRDPIKYADRPVRAPSMTLFVSLILGERLIRLPLLLNCAVQAPLIRFNTHEVIIALLNNLAQSFFDNARHRASRQFCSVPQHPATLAPLLARSPVCAPSA